MIDTKIHNCFCYNLRIYDIQYIILFQFKFNKRGRSLRKR